MVSKIRTTERRRKVKLVWQTLFDEFDFLPFQPWPSSRCRSASTWSACLQFGWRRWKPLAPFLSQPWKKSKQWVTSRVKTGKRKTIINLASSCRLLVSIVLFSSSSWWCFHSACRIFSEWSIFSQWLPGFFRWIWHRLPKINSTKHFYKCY